MNRLFIFLGLMCAVAMAVPVPEAQKDQIELLQIPLENNKELDILALADENGQINERNKRTIGVLRELFPSLSQFVDQKISMITSQLFRTIGPILLRGGLGGGGASRSNSLDDDDDDDDDNDNSISSGGRKVSISLPTFPPDSDEDEEDSISSSTTHMFNTLGPIGPLTTPSSVTSNVGISATGTRVDVGVGSGGVNVNVDAAASDLSPVTESTTVSATDENPEDAAAKNEQLQQLIRVVRQVQAAEQLNQLNQAADQKVEASEPESKTPGLDELSLDDEEDGEDRNKRFLFGLGGGSSGGSGGSGNFLFDIIRRTADHAGRAAGTIYRVVAGTQTGASGDASQSNDGQTNAQTNDEAPSPNLVSRLFSLVTGGSSGSQQTDESANAPADGDDAAKANDGYTEGIPGPVTRLVVLANRGLSNLVQDLILRAAATSERLVNFKARLITSLI